MSGTDAQRAGGKGRFLASVTGKMLVPVSEIGRNWRKWERVRRGNCISSKG